jgi:hypothetical protein
VLNGIDGPAMIYVGLEPARASAEILPFPLRDEYRSETLRAAS